jgi:hypothetical protein
VFVIRKHFAKITFSVKTWGTTWRCKQVGWCHATKHKSRQKMIANDKHTSLFYRKIEVKHKGIVTFKSCLLNLPTDGCTNYLANNKTKLKMLDYYFIALVTKGKSIIKLNSMF